MKRIVFRLLVATVIAYGALELGARLLRPPLMPYAPHCRWVEATPFLTGSKHFTIRTNTFGFRNAPDFSLPRAKTRPLVLLIGDSLMFGGPNDVSLDHALSALLPSADVLNGGSPGAGPIFYADMVDEYLDPLDPDTLFVGLYLGNDFGGPLAEQRASLGYQVVHAAKGAFPNTLSLVKRLRVKRGSRVGEEASPVLPVSTLRKRVLDEVMVYARGLSLDGARLQAETDAYPIEERLRERPLLQCEQGARVIAMAIVFRNELADSLLLQSANAIRNAHDALAQVDRIAARVRRSRPASRLVFVLFPVSFMVDERYAPFYRDLGYAVPPPAANYPLYDRVRAHLRDGGYEILDLHDPLRGRPVFFDEDWHLNAEGNRLAAEAMAGVLQSRVTAR